MWSDERYILHLTMRLYARLSELRIDLVYAIDNSWTSERYHLGGSSVDGKWLHKPSDLRIC